jgi:hypothetical protein
MGKHRHSRSVALPEKCRRLRSFRNTLEFHSLVDPTHCHKCRDKGVYYDDELVGAVTRVGERWTVWRIRDFSQPMDRADQAMYEEWMEHMADFGSLHKAREYVRGTFCEVILREYEARKG